MRVLWLCNIMLPAFARVQGLPYSVREGWLTGSFARLVSENRERTRGRIDLGVCMPVPESLGECRIEAEGAVFYGFLENLDTPEVYDERLEKRFARILEDFKPDLVHIFGTEFPHTLAMTRAYGRPERTLIGIQGLCCAIEETYMANLPYRVQRGRTFRDRVRHDSLREQQRKFGQRAEHEREALCAVRHVTGRTAFDRERTAAIHPGVIYHQMNETLRPDFYGPRWDLNGVQRHSIFLSQGDYPLKGFHFVLQALPMVLKEFPDTQLYVAGHSIIGAVGGQIPERSLPKPVWITRYGQYLMKLIRDGGLKGHVTMLGSLSAERMVERYQKSHIFICPSIMENSANSLCEAMLLGMPVIAADVGGLPSLVENGAEGLLFPGGHAETLAEEICNLFDHDQFACGLGSEAHKTALVRHNPDVNYHRLLEIYYSL